MFLRLKILMNDINRCDVLNYEIDEAALYSNAMEVKVSMFKKLLNYRSNVLIFSTWGI